MMLEFLKTANGLIALITAVGGIVFGLIMLVIRARSEVTTKIAEAQAQSLDQVHRYGGRIDELERSVGALSRSVERLDAHVQGLPTTQHYQALQLSHAEASGRIDVLIQRMEGQGQIIARIEQTQARINDFLDQIRLQGGKLR
ncbi:MAG: hypothetical protein AAGI34_10330 [Pseudomonadota bacterium]